ncbi:PAS domain S-box protein [Flavobacterium sp.]|uniref:PAS domain S-box protein n=1 Tax=Flavobacterium sp. TaxID=239 RepID=UPI001B7C9792|nr:PAS domain S-box protein [Flavobacterium sp.]MBP6182005.1 PAS domain S-box protein [Flavobacterium sp.]
MKISFEKKILLGFIVNLLVVIASGWIFISRLDKQRDQTNDSMLNWIELSLFVLSIVLLTIVYFIIKAQLNAKNISQNLLLENKQLLQSIIDNTSNPIFIKKINGEYLLINKQFGSLFQIPNEEIIGKTDHDFLPKEVADVYRNSDLEVAKALRELKIEEIIQQPDGPHTYLAVKFPLYDTTGRIYAIGGISTDISERKKLEESFKVTDKFFNMSSDLMIIGTKEKFGKVNPAVIKILGYSEEELLNKPYTFFVYPDDLEITKREVAKLQTGALMIQFKNRFVCKDGSIKWLVWSISPELSTGLLYAVARDVTAQKETEDSLVVADKFFNMSNNLLVVAKGEYFIKINPAFTKTLGYTQEDMNTIKFMELTHPDDKNIADEVLAKLLRGDEVVNFEDRVRCKDGTYIWLDWHSAIDIQQGILYSVARDITEKVKNEESLKLVNNFFEISFDAFFVEKGNKIIKINPAFTKILGYDQNDLEKISVLDLMHPDYVNIVSERLTRRLKGEQVEADVMFPMLCKDGSYKWTESVIATDVKAGMIFAVLRDISQKKIDEEKLNNYTQKLKDDEQQIQTIFDGAPDPVIVIDSESNVLRWNPKAEFVFGWKTTEIIGKPLYEFIIPTQHRESHKKGMEHFLTTGEGTIINKTYEIEAVNKEGAEFPVSISVSPIKMGEKYFFIGFVRDITESKKAVDELYENEEKLRLVLENISEGVIVANADKKVVMANYMANEIFGIEEDDKISSNLTDHFELYFPDEKTVFPSQKLPMQRALDGEETNDIDLILWNPVIQQKRRVLISGRPLLDQNDNVVAAVVTIKDISKYKQMEEELKETELKYRQLIGFRKGGDTVT